MSIESGEIKRDPDEIIAETHEMIDNNIKETKEKTQQKLDEAKARIEALRASLEGGKEQKG